MASSSRPPTPPLVVGMSRWGVPYRHLALGLVCLGVFMAMFDLTSLTIALPTFSAEFDIDRSSVLWVVLLPQLTVTSLSLTLGRLGDLYGRKRFFAAGFAFFALGAVLAALAGSFTELLAARLVESMGLMLIMSAVSAVITSAYPPKARGWALGVMGAAVGSGLAAGPIVGGVLLDEVGWRAIFWLFLPLGLLGAAGSALVLHDTPRALKAQRLDVPGAVLLTVALFGIVLAVNRGASWGWGSPQILGVVAASVVAALLFIRVERRSTSPVVALDLFRQRAFTGSAVSAVIVYFAIGAPLVLMPFFLVEAKGQSALEAGAVMVAFSLAVLIASPLGGVLADRAPLRGQMVLAMLVFVAGLLILSTMTITTGIGGIAARLVLIGVARGLFDAPNMSLVMGSVSPDRLGTASAVANSTRALGQAVGVAVAGALLVAQSTSFADAHSALGLDDPAVRPAALLSGTELAFFVAAGVALAGAVLTWWLAAPSSRRSRAESREPTHRAPPS